MLKLDSFLLKKQQKLVDFLCSLYIAGFICYSEALYVFPLSGFTTAASLFPGVGLRLFLLWLRRLKSSRIKGDFFFSFLFFSVAEKDFQHRFFFAGSTFCSLQRNPLFQSQGSWRHMLSPRQIWGGGHGLKFSSLDLQTRWIRRWGVIVSWCLSFTQRDQHGSEERRVHLLLQEQAFFWVLRSAPPAASGNVPGSRAAAATQWLPTPEPQSLLTGLAPELHF